MLSIIIPTYNEEEYLPFLLRSIMAQTYKDFEVIVADNHSTDRTRAIAQEYGATVTDGGNPAGGRNKGAAVSKGEILLFLDADVVLPDPWFLQMTVAEFEKRQLGAATCRVQPLSDKKVDKIFHAAFNYFLWVTAATTPHAPGFCIFARRSVHEALKGFDVDIKLAEDHDYVNRASKIAKFGILKTYKIPVSVRRMERDGRFNIAMKYLLAELYMRTKGNIKSDIFNYTFGYTKGKHKPGKKKGATR
jgi:glycosyltransferase involved in cell wall biosynthesis